VPVTDALMMVGLVLGIFVGVLPALLVFYIRSGVEESAPWRARSRTAFGNWSLEVWSPPMDSKICAP